VNTSHAFLQAPLDTGQMSAGHHAQQTGWSWPLLDQPVDVSALILREWTHEGDSPIIAARPRKQRGAPVPPPTYLLKVGRDAIGERLYSLAARHFDLPSAVVSWTTAAEVHEAAIRFEPDAWRPRRIDPEQGTATTNDQQVTLRNPLDYYRHLALSDLLGEYDGAEFMVWQETLFRIDAATTGWSLFAAYLRLLRHAADEDSTETPEPHSSLTLFTLDHLRTNAPTGAQVYLDMVARIVAWHDLPTVLATELRTCPAAQSLLLSPRACVQAALPALADAVEASLRQHQQVLKTLL
jgi:hypothetical protein